MCLRPHAPLAALTTLGLGGAAHVIVLNDERDFPALADHIGQFNTPPVCLGWGSNVLVSDRGTDVPVLLMRTSGIDVGRQHQGHVLLTVQAGHSLPDLVAFTVTEGLIGIETLAGVPGTVGAMPIQNVGAYGQETADTLTEVLAWDWQLQRRVILTADQCALGHRTSVFKRSHRWTILQVTFALTPSTISAPIIYGELADALDVQIGSRLPTAEVAATTSAKPPQSPSPSNPTSSATTQHSSPSHMRPSPQTPRTRHGIRDEGPTAMITPSPALECQKASRLSRNKV